MTIKAPAPYVPAATGIDGRVRWVDFAKGIGIFLVVLGHALGGLIASGVLPAKSLYEFAIQWMYCYHMPLFFFLAGLFVARSARRPFCPYLINKAALIVYPYVVWSCVTGVAQHFASGYANHALSWSRLLEISYKPIDQYWFLYVIFLMYVLYWLVQRLRLTGWPYLVLASLLYIGQAEVPATIHADAARSVASELIYFASGAMLADGGLLRKAAGLRSAALVMIAVGGYSVIAVHVAFAQWSDMVLAPTIAAVGICSTAALAMAASRWRATAFLATWGIYSLEIYVAHVIFSAGTRVALQHKFGWIDPGLQISAGTLAGLFAPLLLAMACTRLGFPYLFTFSRARLRSESGMSTLRTEGIRVHRSGFRTG
jgi:fucose 4-O-acetylase-like acetyltransferase